MRALLAIREPKAVIALGQWQSGKRMPKSAFPLSKSHSYPLGSSFEWCIIALQGDGRNYRLLVAFDPAKEQFRAWLGLVDGADQALIARLEFHPSHSGWHCHVKSGMLDRVVRGVVKEPRDRDTFRVCDVEQKFGVTQLNALGIAFRVFNASQSASILPKSGELPL
jgi:hypothetical protein